MSRVCTFVQVGFGLVTEALAAAVPSRTDRASWRDVTAGSGHPRRRTRKSGGERGKRERNRTRFMWGVSYTGNAGTPPVQEGQPSAVTRQDHALIFLRSQLRHSKQKLIRYRRRSDITGEEQKLKSNLEAAHKTSISNERWVGAARL